MTHIIAFSFYNSNINKLIAFKMITRLISKFSLSPFHKILDPLRTSIGTTFEQFTFQLGRIKIKKEIHGDCLAALK